MPKRGTSRLPRWGSAEGFHLMESFVTSLDNPAYREQLSRALTMGKGVFRAFKDALKQNKEIEKLWFAYKEQRLRAVIVSWYNANREARGLAKLPAEPEETEELVMSDFSFAWGPGEHAEEVLRLDRDAFFELFPDERPERLEERFAEKRRGMPPAGSDGVARYSVRRDTVGRARRLCLGHHRRHLRAHRAACRHAGSARHRSRRGAAAGSSSRRCAHGACGA